MTEPKIVKAFNKFIEKWCGDSFPHLIDSDENDGEKFREKLRELVDGGNGTIRLNIQDKKDLLILWNALNNAQNQGRINLVQFNTGNKDIDGDWLKETLDEWDRVMEMKLQIETELVNEK